MTSNHMSFWTATDGMLAQEVYERDIAALRELLNKALVHINSSEKPSQERRVAVHGFRSYAEVFVHCIDKVSFDAQRETCMEETHMEMSRQAHDAAVPSGSSGAHFQTERMRNAITGWRHRHDESEPLLNDPDSIHKLHKDP